MRIVAAAGSRIDYEPFADSYDRWYEDPAGARYDRLEKEAIEAFLPPAAEGDRLLEVGSGTGHWSSFLVEQGFRVVGLDISPAMVRVAQSKSIRRARFLVADGGRIPFADGIFDVVAAITVLEFVRDPDRVLEEMARCTRRGGVLIIGALNRRSLLGLRRRLRPSRLFAEAEMFTVGELLDLLRGCGPASARSIAFGWPLWAAPILEWVGRKSRLPWGDFIVARCRVE